MGLGVNLLIRGTTLFIRLKGELDQKTSDDLRFKLNELIVKYRLKNLVFNLSKLDFMDSSGIGIIIGRYNQVKNNGGKIYLCEVNSNIRKIVELSGLTRICSLRESESNLKLEVAVWTKWKLNSMQI